MNRRDSGGDDGPDEAGTSERGRHAPDGNPDALPFVEIHADESCLGNQFRDRPRPGGAAVLLEFHRGNEVMRRDLWTADASTTNNRMALVSATLALGALRKACNVRFVSDSQYLVKGASEWIWGWKRRGWRRKSGAIENVEMWRELDALMARHRVEWVWVRGHAGNPPQRIRQHAGTAGRHPADARPAPAGIGLSAVAGRS